MDSVWLKRVGYTRSVPHFHPLWFHFWKNACKVVFHLTGGFEAINVENIPKTGPVIVAPTHASHLDPPAAGAAIKRVTRSLAREGLFHPKIWGNFLRSVGAFPIRRGEGDTEAIRTAINLLREGNLILIFPEGTRGDGIHLGQVNQGLAVLAKRSGALIIPTAVIGTHKRWPKGKTGPGWGKVTVVYGTPINLDQLTAQYGEKEAKFQVAIEWQRQVLAMCHERGWMLEPPIVTESPQD